MKKQTVTPLGRADENCGFWGDGVYMYDCIHLKACRRQRKLYGIREHPMYCNTDCSAYVSGNVNVITVEEAVKYARSGVESIISGYGAYDVYAECDLEKYTLKKMIDDMQGGQ